jgi:hypothetical protein
VFNEFVAIQFKQKKLIHVYKLGRSEVYLTLENCISRNGKSFCHCEQFIALRNLKKKCFEIVDIELKETVVSFAYEDIWYYNNYHVLGNIFVFPHYMKVTFFDSSDKFK